MSVRIFYDNRLADTYLEASSSADGTHPDNVIDGLAHTWWRPTSLPAMLRVDCDEPRAANSLFVFGHDLWSRGATIEVRGSTDDFDTSDDLLLSVTPSSNRPFVRTFAIANYRYWGVRIPSGATGMPSLACVMVGVELPMEGIVTDDDFDPTGQRLVAQANNNENGRPLGKVTKYILWQQTITLRRCSWSWVRNTFLPAWNAHLRATPFGLIYGHIDEEPRLVTAGDELRTPHRSYGTVDLSFDVTGVVD